MNKSLKALLCCSMAVIFLAGCRGGGSTSGGGGNFSEKEKQAIQKVMDGNVCTLNGATPIVSGQATDVSGDENGYVQVVIKQNVSVDGEKFVVDVDWTYAGYEAAVYRYRTIEGDEYHKNFEFNFPDVGDADKSVEISAVASISGKKADAVKFQLNLKPMKLVFPEWSISEVLKLNGEKTMFAHISDPTKGYFESNQDPEVSAYCYVKTYGEVVYLAPDGNWGLLADGDKWIEIYAGSAYNLNTKTYADLKVGAKVYVYGEPTHYLGNIQIGYISKILTMSDPQKVSAVSAAKDINEAFLQSTTQISQDMNKLVRVSGKFKSKSITTADARGTFVITVGSTDLTIAYDYHTSKEGLSTLFDEMKAILDKAVAGTTTITVLGSFRWANQSKEATPVFGNTSGSWTVVPYLSGHVA